MITGDERIYPSNESGLEKGLTIRQYYTGLAMNALLERPIPNSNSSSYVIPAEVIAASVAALAVKCADEIIKELNKQP